MKVLVTGGCGFIGSHTCEYYSRLGAEVVCFDNMTKHELMRTGHITEAARHYSSDFLGKLGVRVVQADIRDLPSLTRAAEGADFIVHTAAQPAMTIGLEDPELDFSTNALGTFNVLTVARKFGVRMVSCSTIHVYGNRINNELREEARRYIRTPAAIGEEHPSLSGIVTPLHASKRTAEIYLQMFADSYGVETATFRLTGMYGPYQFGGEDHGWVANFAIRAALGRPLTIFGTGKQVRDIVYASDVVNAFHAFYTTRKCGVYNIGGGTTTAISLLDCIDILRKLVGKPLDVQFQPERLGDLRYFICDIGKATTQLGWQPKVLPEEGIRKLIEWLRKNPQLFKLDPQKK